MNQQQQQQPPQKTLLHFWKSKSDISKNDCIPLGTTTTTTVQQPSTSGTAKIKTNNSNANNFRNTNNNKSNQQTAAPIFKKQNSFNNNNNVNKKVLPTTSAAAVNNENIDDDDDDAQLIKMSEKFMNDTYKSNGNKSVSDDHLTVGISETCTQYTDVTGFDQTSGAVWIYPTNFPIRDYQYNIVEQCLFKNTMVVLPTGMGKTFVAAVVMYNFYRWYPEGKVLFMAPTKPLVLQQAEACYKVLGIPREDISQMTGSIMPNQRKIQWLTKRVFFLTPQIIMNDILRGNIDIETIKCVVIDEAHKALGEYAFCKVVESILERNKNFRVVALTATPGNDVKAIQNVIDKLLISHIELRSEESIDVQRYNHSRQVNKYVLKLSDEITRMKNTFTNVIKGPIKRLEMNKVLFVKDINTLNKLYVLDRREQFRRNPPPGLDPKRTGFIEGDFAMVVSFLHGYELLLQYGSKSFYMFLKNFIDNPEGAMQNKTKTELLNNHELSQLYKQLKTSFETTDPVKIAASKTIRHPKLLKLEELILEHFQNHKEDSTRVMIFSQYRESVYEIKEVLSTHEPILKVMEFVGQGAQGGKKGVSQKEQLEVVKKFRDGGYNTLVATCVGEEGLDIGEVDLIICYDAHKSPIRLIQRMGRTGRKRAGRIIILLTEGKEESSYNCSLSKKNSIYKTILNASKSLRFYQSNPAMMPKNFRPKCHKMHITVNDELNDEETKKKFDADTDVEIDETVAAETTTSTTAAKKTKGRPKKNAKNQDKETDNDEDAELFAEPKPKTTRKTTAPKKATAGKQQMKAVEPLLDFNDVDDLPIPVLTEKSLNTSIKQQSLNTTLKSTKATTSKAAPMDLFPRTSLLNNSIKKPPLIIKETTQPCFVPTVADPKVLRNINRINTETFNEIKIDELIKQWQSDEDDFLFNAATTSANTSANDYLNQSEIEANLNKYEEFYKTFESNVNINDEDDDDDHCEDEIMEYHDVLEDEMIEDNLLKNFNLNTIKAAEEPAVKEAHFEVNKEEPVMACEDNHNENDDDVEMGSIINDTLSYDDIQAIVNVETAKAFKVSTLVPVKPSIVKAETAVTAPTKTTIDQFNIYGVKLEDLFSSNEDEDEAEVDEFNVAKNVQDDNICTPNSQDSNKDVLNDLILCDELLEHIEADIDIDYHVLDRLQNERKMSQSVMKSAVKEPQIERISQIEKNEEHDSTKKSPIVLQQRSTSTPLRNISSFNDKLLKEQLQENNEKPKMNNELERLALSNAGRIRSKSSVNLQQALDASVESKSVNISSNVQKLENTNKIMFDMKVSLADLFDDDDESEKVNNDNKDKINEEHIENDIIDDSCLLENYINEKSKSILCVEPKKVAIVKPLNTNNDYSRHEKTSNLEMDISKKSNINKASNDFNNSEDTFYIAKKKKKTKFINSFNSSGDEHHQVNDDDDDDDDDVCVLDDDVDENEDLDDIELIACEDEYRRKTANQQTKKPVKKKKKPLSSFIEDEAEVSDEEMPFSSDEEDDLDNYDLRDSFVDVNNYSCDESMMYKYKQSLRDAHHQQQPHFMTRKLAPITDDIFSQAPQQDASYMYDSFVVEDDETIYHEEKKKKPKKKNSKKIEDDSLLLSILEEQEKLESGFKKPTTTKPKQTTSRIKPLVEDIIEENEVEEEEAFDEDEIQFLENLYKKNSTTTKNEVIVIDSVSEIKKPLPKVVEVSQATVFAKTMKPEFIAPKPVVVVNNERKINNNNNSLITIENKPKIEPKLEVSIPVQNVKKDEILWIIVDTIQLAAASDIIQAVRKNSIEFRLSIQTCLNCDFIISQRMGLLRFKYTDISSPANRNSVIDKVTKSKAYYPCIAILIEDDREAVGIGRARSKYFDGLLAAITQAQILVLFSKHKSEQTHQLVFNLCKSEYRLGYGINFDCDSLLTIKKKDNLFYNTLPGMSFVNALYLTKNYNTIVDFCKSIPEEIKVKGKMSDRKARILFNFLNS